MGGQAADATGEPEQFGAATDGIFGMSVTVELTGATPSSLRLYERRGLLGPGRSAGGTRRYSRDDVVRIRRIAALLAAGLNLAGIAVVLDLQDDNARLQTELDQRAAPDPGPEPRRSLSGNP